MMFEAPQLSDKVMPIQFSHDFRKGRFACERKRAVESGKGFIVVIVEKRERYCMMSVKKKELGNKGESRKAAMSPQTAVCKKACEDTPLTRSGFESSSVD